MPAELRVTCDVCHGVRPPKAAGWQQFLIGNVVGVGWGMNEGEGDVRVDRNVAVYLCSAHCRANWHEQQHRTARADRPVLPKIGDV